MRRPIPIARAVFTITIPHELRQTLAQKAEAEDQSISRTLADILSAYFKAEKRRRARAASKKVGGGDAD